MDMFNEDSSSSEENEEEEKPKEEKKLTEEEKALFHTLPHPLRILILDMILVCKRCGGEIETSRIICSKCALIRLGEIDTHMQEHYSAIDPWNMYGYTSHMARGKRVSYAPSFFVHCFSPRWANRLSFRWTNRTNHAHTLCIADAVTKEWTKPTLSICLNCSCDVFAESFGLVEYDCHFSMNCDTLETCHT